METSELPPEADRRSNEWWAIAYFTSTLTLPRKGGGNISYMPLAITPLAAPEADRRNDGIKPNAPLQCDGIMF